MLRRFTPLAFFLLLLYLLPTSWGAFLRNETVRLLAPTGRLLVRQNTRIRNSINNLTQLDSLEEERLQLQQEVAQLESEVSDRERLQRENQSLRAELGVTGVTQEAPKVFTQVILRGSDQLDPTFTVDVGTVEHVKVGQPAVYQGALIGRVISVRQNTAIIRSLTSQQSHIQARIAESQEKGLLTGSGSTALLQDINQGVTVKRGQVVETSGLGGSLPQGILIGQVGETISKQSELSQEFTIQLAQDPAAVQSLFILLIDLP